MQSLLQKFTQPDAEPVPLLKALVQAIRPRQAHDDEAARQSIYALCYLLEQDAEARVGVRRALRRLFTDCHQVSLYTESGIFPNTEFGSEVRRRLSRIFLPDVPQLGYLRDVLAVVFYRPSDRIWVAEVGVETWGRLLAALCFEEEDADAAPTQAMPQLLEALRVLSFRIAAIGLEPEMLRLEPSLEQFASPFMEQSTEMHAYLAHYAAWWDGAEDERLDEKQLLVLLDQCRAVAQRIHTRAAREGTSLSLTLQLRRLRQHLSRSEALIAILAALHVSRSLKDAEPAMAAVTCDLIQAECRKNNLHDYLARNVELLALRVTDNARQTGEHYISETRDEYFALWRAAIGAGVLIALMAGIKIVLKAQQIAPLTEAIAFSLNYGIGFVIIHLLHFTVSTKQPAMTANAIAASIGESSGKTRDLDKLTTLIAHTIRSQIAAIFGNVLLAVPCAMLVGLAAQRLVGDHFVDHEKAAHMLAEIQPSVENLLFAAVAGVCLFLSGLIAGYYDNLAVYNHIPARIVHLRWPRAIFGESNVRRFAQYLEHNLGALAGNFFFGCMLGGAWAIGVLFGLPFDIRHIAFSSANLGYSLVAFDFNIDPHILLPAIAGVMLIGAVNLLVSFALALYVALRARQVTFAQRRILLKALWQRLIHQPGEFLLPPKRAEEETSAQE